MQREEIIPLVGWDLQRRLVSNHLIQTTSKSQQGLLTAIQAGLAVIACK